MIGKIRRVIVFIVGFALLLIGVLLIVLPGPSFIFIPLGLLVLASEFFWAKEWLVKVMKFFKRI